MMYERDRPEDLESIPLTKEFRIDMARLEIPVSGWTCLSTVDRKRTRQQGPNDEKRMNRMGPGNEK